MDDLLVWSDMILLRKKRAISKMIKDAVRTAIILQLRAAQKEVHDEAMQKLVDEHRAINSPLSGTNLQKTSAISYNSMGGIYTTPLATSNGSTILSNNLLWYFYNFFWWGHPNFKFSRVLSDVIHKSISSGERFSSKTR